MNILVFTVHYPFKNEDSTATKAVHYFAKEWVKQGHNVIVIHNYIELWIKSSRKKIDSYQIEGVKVLFNPVDRYFPKIGLLTRSEVEKCRTRIINYLNSETFVPDKIAVHFCTEQWQIIESLKSMFDVRPVPIFHNHDIKYDRKIKKIIKSSSKVGVRSQKIMNKILSVSNKKVELFQVYSGAPDDIYIESINTGANSKPKLLYAGNLISLKNVDITIKALSKLKSKYDFAFIIIGSGDQKDSLMELVSKEGLESRIIFLPRMNRENVIAYMKQSDCFVMVSKPETLGIVYIEAMASGCFVIGSKNEGIDGIIVDKKSGLLVQPNEIESLVAALIYYFELDSYKKESILKESFNQALKFSETAVSKDYLNKL